MAQKVTWNDLIPTYAGIMEKREEVYTDSLLELQQDFEEAVFINDLRLAAEALEEYLAAQELKQDKSEFKG